MLHCEEYAVSGAPPTNPPPQLAPDDGQRAEDPGDYRGLCQDCAVRFTCNYPRAPGGVWHCAEYE